VQNNKISCCCFYEHLPSILNLPDCEHEGLPISYEHLPFAARDISVFSFDMSMALPCAQNIKLKAAADKT
jgi:hypothetical protein